MGIWIPSVISASSAYALAKVQEVVKRDGYGLVMFDCYRPQRAVNHFVRWAEVRMPRPSSSTSSILINSIIRIGVHR